MNLAVPKFLAVVPSKYWIGGAVVLAVAVASIAGRSAMTKLDIARAEAADARKAETVALHKAEAIIKLDSALQLHADSLKAQSDAAKAKAAAAELAAAKIRGSLAALSKAAPDTCHPIIVTADSALAADSAVIASLHVAVAKADSTAESRQHSIDSLRTALITLHDASKTLAVATENLEKKSKPSFLARFLPHAGAGATGGLDVHGKPNAVAGVTLGWSF